MGTVGKLLFKQLESYSALRAISTRIPHHPLVVAVSSGIRFIYHVLAVGTFIPFPFRTGCQVRSSPTSRHCISPSFFVSTSAPRGISIPFLTPYITFFQPLHMPFSCPFPAVAFVPAAGSPRNLKSNHQYRRNCPHRHQYQHKTKINT